MLYPIMMEVRLAVTAVESSSQNAQRFLFVPD